MADSIWKKLSVGAREALVTGQRPYMNLRQELFDHGLIFDPDTPIMEFTDAGCDLAEDGRESLASDHTRLLDRLMYFTECQLATVEYLKGRSRTPKGRLRRQESIGDKMIEECLLQGLKREDAQASKCPRVAEKLPTRE